jgi:hypothetical protein
MIGLARTSAASGALLLNLEGLATMAIAWVVFRENVDRRLLLGAASILAGAVVLSWQGQGIRFDEGGLLIAAACLAWGIDNNLTRRLSSADPVVIALIKGLVAGGANVTLALILGARLPSIGATAAALVVGFFGVGVSLVLFVLALRHLGSALSSCYVDVKRLRAKTFGLSLKFRVPSKMRSASRLKPRFFRQERTKSASDMYAATFLGQPDRRPSVPRVSRIPQRLRLLTEHPRSAIKPRNLKLDLLAGWLLPLTLAHRGRALHAFSPFVHVFGARRRVPVLLHLLGRRCLILTGLLLLSPRMSSQDDADCSRSGGADPCPSHDILQHCPL